MDLRMPSRGLHNCLRQLWAVQKQSLNPGDRCMRFLKGGPCTGERETGSEGEGAEEGCDQGTSSLRLTRR